MLGPKNKQETQFKGKRGITLMNKINYILFTPTKQPSLLISHFYLNGSNDLSEEFSKILASLTKKEESIKMKSRQKVKGRRVVLVPLIRKRGIQYF